MRYAISPLPSFLTHSEIQVLDQLLLSQESHIGLPDPRSILPYLGLYTLVPLAPERLINVNFLVFSEAELSEIHNGRWTVVPPGRTPSSSTTARIHDTTALRLTDRADSSPKIDLSTTARPEQRYWRLPTRIAPMLAALLDRVAFLANSDCEEIKLAIRLRNLLLIAPHNLEKSSSLVGGSSSNSPGDQGRNMSGGGKREHKGDDRESCKRGRNNQCQSGAKTGASAVGHQHKDGGLPAVSKLCYSLANRFITPRKKVIQPDKMVIDIAIE